MPDSASHVCMLSRDRKMTRRDTRDMFAYFAIDALNSHHQRTEQISRSIYQAPPARHATRLLSHEQDRYFARQDELCLH